jgi:hypothetical protein
VRTRIEKERGGWLWRLWSSDYRQGEIAYAFFGFRGPRIQIEFPSEWHEHRRAWVSIGLGLVLVCFSFPWRRVVPDHGQCSGPTYGFYFFEDHFVVQWGKSTGRPRSDPKKFFYLPWSWQHIRHDYLNPDGSLHHRSGPREYDAPAETKESHPYTYVLRNGTVQNRTATINGEEREWRWRWFTWLPWPRQISRVINVSFNDEVGERTGSWKGGTLGCGWEWKHGESMLQALRRMERERKFT